MNKTWSLAKSLETAVIAGALSLMTLLSLSGISFAESNPDLPSKNRPAQLQKHHPKGGPMGEALKQLNLSEDQQKQVHAIMASHKPKANFESLRQKHEQLAQMMRSGNGSKAEALALSREISDLKAEMAQSRIEMVYDLKSVLTPDQFTQLTSRLEARRANWQAEHGKGHHAKPGKNTPSRETPETTEE